MRKSKAEENLNPGGLTAPQEAQKEKRKTIITIVLLVLLAVGGVYGMFAMLTKAAHRDPGYYKLEAPKSEAAPVYAAAYAFEHYFEGESLAIKYAIDACSKVYGDALLHIYQLTDAKNQYEGCKNIAYLNANPGSEVELEKELFDILASANEHTSSGEYNMFAGALIASWNDIIYTDDPAEFDPLVNETQNRRISLAAECAQNTADFTFEIVDPERHIVRFNVSEGYKAIAEANDFGETVIDLGQLRDAFIIDSVCAVMEEAGYDNGFMSSASGVTKALSGMSSEGHEYACGGLVNGAAVQAYSLPMLEGSACCALRVFGMEGEIGCYTVETSGGAVAYRHPNYSVLSGQMNDAIISACAYKQNSSALEVAAAALRLIGCNDAAEAGGIGGEALLSYVAKDSTRIHASPRLAELLKVLDTANFTVEY